MRICGSADFRMYKRRRSTCDLADLTPSACIDTGQAATPGQKQRPYDSCSMMLCLAACPYTMDGIRQPSSAKTGTARRTGRKVKPARKNQNMFSRKPPISGFSRRERTRAAADAPRA